MNELSQSTMKFVPKYYQIKLDILQDIKSGKYTINSKLPSKSELMREYNVSCSPVEQLIHELAQENVIYTIQGKGCFVRDHKTDRKLSASVDIIKRIALITTNSSNEFYAKTITGVLDIIQSKGYILEIYNSEEKYANETKILGKFIQNPVSGIIFSPSSEDYDYKHVFKLQEKGIPIVLLDRNMNNYNLDFVSSDNVKGARDAVKYLVKCGHRQIVCLGAFKYSSTMKERFEGYRQALNAKKIKIDKGLIILLGEDLEQIDLEMRHKISSLLSGKTKFTAVFALNDFMAVRILKLLKEKGIKVPGDISVMGFDDLDMVNHIEVPLTTVKQYPCNLGSIAAKLLIRRIEDIISGKQGKAGVMAPEKILYKTKIIIRNSVKKIN